MHRCWRSLRPFLPVPKATSGATRFSTRSFDWKILKSEHFDNFFYGPESTIVHDAARMAERWYARHSDTFRHAFDRKSLVFYADHPDFEQTNVVGEQLEEGTGGVTESNRTRVIMPFTGIYADNDHVLGHELVHVFQYNIAEGTPGGGLMRLDALPLWLIEGMAEYFSLGRDDPLTAMWMRDAVHARQVPDDQAAHDGPALLPVPLRTGAVGVRRRTLGRSRGRRRLPHRAPTRLGQGARPRARRESGFAVEGLGGGEHARCICRRSPDGRTPTARARRSSDWRAAATTTSRRRSAPTASCSPSSRSRSLFSIDLFVADAVTGKVIKKLGGPSSDPHFDAISFINSAGDWSPDGGKFAFIVYAEGANEIAILNTKSTNVERRIKLPGIGSVSHVVVVAGRPDARVLRTGRRHQRSVSARSREAARSSS